MAYYLLFSATLAAICLRVYVPLHFYASVDFNKKKNHFVQAKVWTHHPTIEIQVHNQLNQVIFHANIYASITIYTSRPTVS